MLGLFTFVLANLEAAMKDMPLKQYIVAELEKGAE